MGPDRRNDLPTSKEGRRRSPGSDYDSCQKNRAPSNRTRRELLLLSVSGNEAAVPALPVGEDGLTKLTTSCVPLAGAPRRLL